MDLNVTETDIHATARTANFTIEKNIQTPGILRVLIVDLGGETIPPDLGSILEIHFSISPEAISGLYMLDLNEIYASDAFNQNVPINDVDGIFIITTNGVIPVELSAFEAQFLREENKIQLSWRTSSETNNYGFEIYRGETATGLKKIGFAPGSGTTSSAKNYIFVDADINADSYYYQLKQVDFDGSSTLSEIIRVEVTVAHNYSLSQNYPNPFSLRTSPAQTTIRFQLPETEFVDIKIYDIIGREVKNLLSQRLSNGEHRLQWDGTSNDGSLVCAGLYYYKMKTEKFNACRKLILLE